MNLAEQVFLLLTRADGKRVSIGVDRTAAVGRAALVELIRAERVAVSPGPVPQVALVDPAPMGDEVLDVALRIVAESSDRGLWAILAAVGSRVSDAVTGVLEARGVVRRESRRFGTRWPLVRSEEVARVRQRYVAALRTQDDPPVDVAWGIAVLHRAGAVRSAFPSDDMGMPGRDLDRRAARIRERVGLPEAASDGSVDAVVILSLAMVVDASDAHGGMGGGDSGGDGGGGGGGD